jgi:hypothetical protein
VITVFSDLNNQNLNKILLSKVKAYPSVNSPNDGGFNSEENMRWLTKAIANKPFIIGSNDDIVNSQFGSNGASGNGMYSAPAMFSIDGYLFKLANQEDLSFDNTDKDTFMTINTQTIQRFIHEMTNQGTEYEISPIIDDFMFTKYNPKNIGSTITDETGTYVLTEERLKENWKNAYDNHKCVGYVKNLYTGSYANQFTYYSVDGWESVKFRDTLIRIGSYPYDINNIPSFLIGEPFATEVSRNDDLIILKTTIFYPLYFEDIKTWNKEQNKYLVSQRIQFTDIYGLTMYYDYQICNSRSYPTTHNVFADMDNHYPLNSISFDNCNLVTIPKNIYDFTNLYENNYANRKETYSYSGGESYSSSLLSSLFSIREYNDYKSLIPTSDVPYIRNTLKYYCLKFDPNNDPRQEIGENKIDVVFMDSEGSLCPEGLMYSDTTKVGARTHDGKPFESYVHFIKRLYLYNTTGIVPQESDINNLVISDIVNSVEFSNLYNTYIAKPMSFYLHFSYCSLLDNVIYYDSNVPETKRIKAAGCGKALVGFSGITQDDENFNAIQTFTYNSYEMPNIDTPVQTTTNVSYHLDIDSDNRKAQRYVEGKPYISCDTPTLKLYKHENMDDTKIEDPLNYLRRCSYRDNKGIREVQLYRISGNSLVLVTNVNYVNIDDYLMPKTLSNPSSSAILTSDLYFSLYCHSMISLSTIGSNTSMINGMCLRWNEPCWMTEIPFTINVDKDNLGYLKCLNFEKPNTYFGINFNYKLPQDVLDTDLFVYNLIISTTNIIGHYDIETSTREEDMLSEYSKHRRESYIHFNKLYGDNYETLEEHMKNLADEVIIPDISSDLSAIFNRLDALDSETEPLGRVTINENRLNDLYVDGENPTGIVADNIERLDDLYLYDSETETTSGRVYDLEQRLNSLIDSEDPTAGIIPEIENKIDDIYDDSTEPATGILADAISDISHIQNNMSEFMVPVSSGRITIGAGIPASDIDSEIQANEEKHIKLFESNTTIRKYICISNQVIIYDNGSFKTNYDGFIKIDPVVYEAYPDVYEIYLYITNPTNVSKTQIGIDYTVYEVCDMRVTLSESNKTIAVGNDFILNGTLYPNIIGDTFEWITSNENIARIEFNDSTSRRIVGVSEGNAIITLKYTHSNITKSAQCMVHVTE